MTDSGRPSDARREVVARKLAQWFGPLQWDQVGDDGKVWRYEQADDILTALDAAVSEPTPRECERCGDRIEETGAEAQFPNAPNGWCENCCVETGERAAPEPLTPSEQEIAHRRELESRLNADPEFIREMREPFTPPRPSELTEAVIAELKRVRDHLVERVHESDARSERLEGALRALVAKVDHGGSQVFFSKAAVDARALLAESTPNPEAR